MWKFLLALLCSQQLRAESHYQQLSAESHYSLSQPERFAQEVDAVRCSDVYGVNWDQWRVNISFYLDLVAPAGVHFVPKTKQLSGMLAVARDLMAEEDGGLSCPPAVATCVMLQILPQSTNAEFLWFDILNRQPQLLTKQALATVGALHWSVLVRAKWHMFYFLSRLRKYFLEISHNFLNGDSGSNPVPAERSLRKYLLHVEHALKTGGRFDVAWSQRILADHGYYRYPCGKPNFSPDPDVRPTAQDVACLNQVLYTVVATLAVAEGHRDNPGQDYIFNDLLDRAFSVAGPWLNGDGAATPIFIFLSRWPIFEMLDRLEMATSVRIKMPPASKRGDYYSGVFPFREKVSNYVRACQQPYCAHNFFELMESLRDIPNMRLIEVGANLGDCSLFAATMYDIPVIAFEPLALSVQAFRRAIRENNLEGQVVVHPTAVGKSTGMMMNFYQVGQRIGNAFAWASSTNPYDGEEGLGANATMVRVNVSTLNDLVPITPTNDVIKMWAFNDSLDILRGGSNLLDPVVRGGLGKVAAIWIGLFVEYHGDSLEYQLEQYWDVFDANGLIYRSCPMQNATCNTPAEVVEVAKTDGIFPIVASRTPTVIPRGHERDLLKPSAKLRNTMRKLEQDELSEEETRDFEKFKPTKLDTEQITTCGWSLSDNQRNRMIESGIDDASPPVSFL